MGLEPLHLVERRQPGVGVVQPDHEAVADQVLAEMVQPRAAIGLAVQRPAETVLDQAGPVLSGGDLPQLLDAEPVGLRIDALAQAEAGHELLGQRAAAPFGEQRVGSAQFHARRVVRPRFALPRDAHVAGGHAHDAPVLLQQLGGGEAGIDLHPERLGLGRQPAADIAEAHDIVAVVVHVRHHRAQHRHLHAAGLGEVQHAVLARRRVERRSLLAPVGDQLVERAGLDHGAGQDVRADLAALLDQAHARVRRQLLEPDRRRQPGRAAADHHDVELHGLALRHSSSPLITRPFVPGKTRSLYRPSGGSV